MEQQVIAETPSESIKMEFVTSDDSGSCSKHMIYFNGGGSYAYFVEKDKFNTILEEELSWGSEKISIIASSYPEPVLVTPEECSLLRKRFNAESDKEREAEEKARTATTCGIKMMVGIKKDALKEQSQHDVIAEILRQSPLIESLRFFDYWS